MATQQRDIRITDLDVERTRRVIRRIQASRDVSEAWHRMTNRSYVAPEDEDDGLDGARGLGLGLTISVGVWLGVFGVVSWWFS